jgi:formiminotetrahydrofolate cyclodeaminase
MNEKLENEQRKYQTMSIKNFVNSVGARTAIPGGGCVAALVASLGSALACMSSLLTYGNKKFEKLDSQIREILPSFYEAYIQLIELIDLDAKAFDSFVVRLIYISLLHLFYGLFKQLIDLISKYF